MSVSPEAQELFDWGDVQKRKHRIMTWAEYRAWAFGGDAISFRSESNPFPGGITIVFGTREQRDIVGTVG